MGYPGRRSRRWTPCALLAVALVTVACAAPAAEVRPPEQAGVDVAVAASTPERVPAGGVRVAYPDEPAHFLDLRGDDAAARDLQALWGLPLFRVDPAGQLADGLVADWEADPGAPGEWTVALTLRPGRWSDGTQVTAADLVATVEALRSGPRADELGLLTGVTATGDASAELTFARPYARWWAILDGVGVLPAAVLADGGLDAYRDGVPVAGGAFRVTERVPGLRTSFAANPDSPLGAPGLEELHVSVVPRFEAALGLLRRGDAQVALGYLALNPVERARRVPDVEAAAPLGGTTVGLWWRPGGPVGSTEAAPRRRAVAAAIDVSQLVEGLLGPAGEAASSVVPGVAGPETGPADAEVGDPTVVLPRWAEAVAFTARALQRDLRSAGGGMQLVSEATPEVVELGRTSGDAVLAARRTGPSPSFIAAVADRELALAADAAGPGSEPYREALAGAADDALATPLYRVGVAHAWSPQVRGVRPSSWPGLGLWDAASWTVGGPGDA